MIGSARVRCNLWKGQARGSGRAVGVGGPRAGVGNAHKHFLFDSLHDVAISYMITITIHI